MDATNTIHVSEICGSDLITREAAQELIASIDLSACTICNVFELDFSNVEFMSRSFADQLHKERVRMQTEKECEIAIINANTEILEMLTLVSKTQTETSRKAVDVPVYHFSDAKKLTEHLFAL